MDVFAASLSIFRLHLPFVLSAFLNFIFLYVWLPWQQAHDAIENHADKIRGKNEVKRQHCANLHKKTDYVIF